MSDTEDRGNCAFGCGGCGVFLLVVFVCALVMGWIVPADSFLDLVRSL